MIDLHNHLLPGIDDGARTVADAIELLRIAASDGITRMVMTPHIQPGRYNNNVQTIKASFGLLTQAVKQTDLTIELGMAAEVHLDPQIISMLENEQIPFLGEEDGFKIMLLELPHHQVPPGTEQLIAYLMKQNIRPMIAHPERNRAIMEDIDKLHRLRDLGCLVQLTSSSITGSFGLNIHRTSILMLNQGHVDIIASDSHDNKYRPPILSTATSLVSALLGEAKAWDLVSGRPGAISESKFH